MDSEIKKKKTVEQINQVNKMRPDDFWQEMRCKDIYI